MSAHREIQAHLNAAERNPLKRAQHLLSAVQYADTNNIPHFGRWTESAIHARHAVHEQREHLRKVLNRERLA